MSGPFCDRPAFNQGAASAAPALALSEQRASALLALWLSMRGCLPERVLGYVDTLRTRGDRQAYARPAHYVAAAAGSATAATYSLSLARTDGPMVVTSIEHPNEGGANILASALRVGGQNRIDSDVLCDAWCDPEGTTEDPRNLPHPIVVGTGDTLALDVTGTGLDTSGIIVRGFHVDEVTAEIFAQGGELCLEGINRTHAAAAVMASTDDRVIRTAKRLSHICAKETLGGDAVRANFALVIQTHRLTPKEGAVIPSRGTMKAGSRCDLILNPSDSVQVQQRYTSAGGAGTAVLQLSLIGRRRYR